ncbi:MAG TPA: hypothetical protein VKI00_23735 [Mycobacterium sp.]|uniref:hypothetical protein n=1 Tax=Mycobacterium sp. TaxID=1785 RepID=UPI002BD162FB|nr:hypothetical protein [Mycobacterium sp.]HME78546.1 hypothetical protein [Mycobacterium sp.]
MKAKRETPPPRGGDRRRGQSNTSRSTGRRPADPAPARRRPRAGKASAPAREPRIPRSGPQTTPISRPVERPARPKNASQAKARAKARKAKAPKVVRQPLRDRLVNRLASIDLRPRTLAARVPFVVLVIGSLGAGLGLTLWLSTDSAERSYQLSTARQQTRLLQEQKEALERDVLEAQSAPALAEAARGLGMIPTRDTAHLIQDPTGNWVVVGSPKPAQGVPPPPLNTKLPDEKPAPPPGARGNSVEVPMRVLPGNGAPAVPLAPGPDMMVRTPDGAITLGPEHFPSPPGMPQLPAAGPGPVPQAVPGAPPAPGLPPALPPAAVVPVPNVPLAPGPAPLGAPAAPAAPVVPPAAAPPPDAAPPAGVPHLATPPAAPLIGEQFGPLTVTTPGAPR